jgi:hypothetical protein
VLSVDADGVATVEVTMESYAHELEDGRRTLTYDSAKDVPPMASAPVTTFWRAARVGQVYIARIDRRGRFLSVGCPDDHAATHARFAHLRAQRGLPTELDERGAGEVRSEAEGIVDPVSWQIRWLPLPDGPIGRTWQVTTTRPSILGGELTLRVEVDGTVDVAGTARRYVGAVQSPPERNPQFELEIPRFELRGTFDFGGGALIEQSERTDIEATATFSGEGGDRDVRRMTGAIETLATRL